MMMTFRIGPLTKSDGKPLAGTNVTVAFGDQEYHGITDEDGNIVISLSGAAAGELVTVTISNQGYSTLTQTVELTQGAELVASMNVPEVDDTLYLIVGVVLLLLVIGALVILRVKRVG